MNVYLAVRNAVEAMSFYAEAFGAERVMRLAGPDGGTLHAEMRIGNSTFMISDESPQWQIRSPTTLGGAGASIHLFVEDADAVFQRAVEAGCTPLMPLSDVFWGDRYGKVTDPFGHQWGIATRKEDLSPEEISRRATEFFASMPGPSNQA